MRLVFSFSHAPNMFIGFILSRKNEREKCGIAAASSDFPKKQHGFYSSR